MELVSSVSTRALCLACEKLGLDIDALLTGAGLSRSEVDDPDGYISRQAAYRFFELAFAESGDPHLALHAVEALDFGAYRALDFLAANAPTLGAAFERVSAYFKLIDPAAELVIASCDDEVRCILRTRGEEHAPPAAVEYTLAALYLRTRAAMGASYSPTRVTFAFTEPETTFEHERIFACPTQFDQPESALHLSHDTWAMPIAGAQAALFEVLDAHAKHLLQAARPTADLISQVSDVLFSELRGGSPSVATVAKRLGMGTRTLQRRLEDHQRSFAELLDDARRAMSLGYVAQQDISLGDIAHMMGFLDQSSFSRAFKRWHDETPTAHRQRLRAKRKLE